MQKTRRKEPFQTFAEIKEYLKGDFIECLICGAKRKALGNHVRKSHGLSPDDYKAKFGIPKSIGLVSRETFNKISVASKVKFQDEDYLRKEQERLRVMSPDGRNTAREVNRNRVRLLAENNLMDENRRRREIPKEEISSWLNEMKELNLTPKEYFLQYKGKSLVFYNNFFAQITRFSLEKEYDELWESLPTAKTLNSSKMTKKLMNQIVHLYKQVKTQTEIAQELGINRATVLRYIKLYNKELKA
jgi:hypothetical protein